jgi:nucleotide-binding universal stress UspA family protein
MKLIDRIIVPTDFSRSAEDALGMATWVARRFDSEIILLHVVPGKSERYSRAVEMLTMDVEEELQHTASRLREAGVSSVQTCVAFGIPFEQINKHAVETDANVIMIGGRDAEVGEPEGLGTTAAEVRRTASKSVWIVKPRSTPPVERIVCPVDFSEASERALKNTIHLTRGLGASLVILTVAPCPSGTAGLLEATARSRELGVSPEAVLLDRLLERYDLYNVRFEKMIREGRPYDEIVKVVQETKCDLLVMGSMGRRGLAHMFMGGVTRSIAQAMPCSLVTVRSESAIRVRPAPENAQMEEHFALGHELLALGFAEEAIKQFRHCITEDETHASAWEGLASAYERLGRVADAKKCMEKADSLVQSAYHKEIEGDVRVQHVLFRPMFGLK